MLLLSEHQLYAVALFWGREACRAVVRNDREIVLGAEVSEQLLSAGHQRADDPQVPGVDGVVGLHRSEDSVVEAGHHEGLSQVIKMLSHRDYVVSFSSSAVVDHASLHS